MKLFIAHGGETHSTSFTGALHDDWLKLIIHTAVFIALLLIIAKIIKPNKPNQEGNDE